MAPASRDPLDRLDAELDALSRTAPPPPDLDAALVETDRRLRVLDAAGAPDPALAGAIWRALMNDAGLVGSVPLNALPEPAVNGRVAPRPWRDHLPALPVSKERGRWAQAQFATALLLLVTLGAIYVSFAPNWRNDSVPAGPTEPAEVGPVAFLWQTTGEPGASLTLPSSVNVDPRGNLWVADGGNHRFQIFGADGAYLETWGAPGSGAGQFNLGTNPDWRWGDIAFDDAGGFYIADSGNKRVQKFDADRQFLTAWGEEGMGDGQFLNPNGIALGADGRIYVTDTRRDDVQVFDADGRFLFGFGGRGSGAGQFMGVGLIAVAPDGSLWIADAGNYRIQHFSPDGTFLESWGSLGSGDGQFLRPNDVAVDEQGRVFVTDLSGNRVQVFDSQGRFLASWGSGGSGEGQFSSPYGIALDGAGQVYVSEWHNHRVQAFRLGRQLRELSPPERDS